MGTPVPYITLAELKRAPIYTQLQKLVPGQSDADRDAELAAVIKRASAMINGEVNQNLAATLDNEVGRVTVSDGGDLRIHTRNSPIISVQSIWAGSDIYSLTQITDLTHMVLDPWRITIPRGANQLNGLNLPMTGFGRPGQRLWAQFTYVNGYPVTTLASAVSAGATSITVKDATGIVANQTLLTIHDGRLLEQVVPSAVNGNTLTVPALVNAHAAGVGVDALPDDLKEATLLLISRLHDTWSLSMGSITHDGTGARNGTPKPKIMCDCASILAPYKRMW
jgi:hypothetical protein